MKNQRNLHPVLLALLLCLLPLVSAPAREPKSQAVAAKGFPKQLDKLKLYSSESGYVYAASKSASDQIDKIIGAAVKEIRQKDANAPGQGLVIVMDLNHEPPFSTEQLLIKMAEKDADGKQEKKTQKAMKSLSEKKKELEELGLDMNLILSIAPMPIEPNMLPVLIKGFPQDADRRISWCMTIPTERNIRYGMKKFIEAGMRKEKVGVVARVAMFPLLAFVENKVIDELKNARQEILQQFLKEKQKPSTDEQEQDKDLQQRS